MSEVMDAEWLSTEPAEPMRASMISEMEVSTEVAAFAASVMAAETSS